MFNVEGSLEASLQSLDGAAEIGCIVAPPAVTAVAGKLRLVIVFDEWVDIENTDVGVVKVIGC